MAQVTRTEALVLVSALIWLPFLALLAQDAYRALKQYRACQRLRKQMNAWGMSRPRVGIKEEK